MQRHKNQHRSSLPIGLKIFPPDGNDIQPVTGTLLSSNLFQNVIEDINKLDNIEKDFQTGPQKGKKKIEMILYKNSKILSQHDDKDSSFSSDSDGENHNAFYTKMLHKFQNENEIASNHKDNSKSKHGSSISHQIVKAKCSTVASKPGKKSSNSQRKNSPSRTVATHKEIKLFDTNNSISDKKKKKKKKSTKSMIKKNQNDIDKTLEPIIEEKKAEQNQFKINIEYPREALGTNIIPNPLRATVKSLHSLPKNPVLVPETPVESILPQVSLKSLPSMKMKRSTNTIIRPPIQSSPLNNREVTNSIQEVKHCIAEKGEESVKILSRESSHKILKSEYDECQIPVANVQNTELPVISKKTNPNTPEKGSENISVNNEQIPLSKPKKKKSCFCGIPICF